MWSWHPLLMSSRRRFCAPNRECAKRYSACDGDNKEFVAGESTKETAQTIAQGMPGVPVTCGLPCAFLCTAAGAPRTRHSPAPSVLQGAMVLAKLGRISVAGIFWLFES